MEPYKRATKTGTTVIVAPKSQPLNISNLHSSIKFIITITQFLGLMPVYGIRHISIDHLRFRWFSLKTCYSFLAALSIFGTGSLYLAQFIREDINFGHFVSFIFYSSQAIGYILFIRLAKMWLHINKQWFEMESKMKRYDKINLSRRFKITAVIILSLSLVEHVLSIMKSIHISQYCPVQKKEPLKAFFSICCTEIFTITAYSHLKAVLAEVSVIMATFHWNFVDLFIILMSAALAERFRQINKHVLNTQFRNEYFWREIREDYTRLWMLCKTLDDGICHLISLSFANNLFFICWQMFNSFKPLSGFIETVYFFFSFGYLLCRTGTVSVYCCWINDESKEMLSSLFNLPTEFYGQEANRLIQQICFCPPALTGSNFFSVTRGLCLQVAGAIITFEIILVQIGPAFLQTDKQRDIFCIS